MDASIEAGDPGARDREGFLTAVPPWLAWSFQAETFGMQFNCLAFSVCVRSVASPPRARLRALSAGTQMPRLHSHEDFEYLLLRSLLAG